MSSSLPVSSQPNERYTLWIFDGMRWDWVTNLQSIANARLLLDNYPKAISAVVKLKGYRKRNAPALARFYKENGQWYRGKV